MYCVKCGVRLEAGAVKCPLCATPVWNPGGEVSEEHYNAGLFPKKNRAARYFALSLATALLAAAALACLIVCLSLYGRVNWSGLVMLGTALIYIIAVLPLWFPRYRLWVFVPLDFAAIEGFLVYVNAYVHGHWYLSFAFPVTGLVFLLTLGGIALVV
ncbi:MAG: hypothetical protein J5859_00425, partial [Clostridia bacterium]|nr:hypothetical protein [Clostridia bacterium]